MENSSFSRRVAAAAEQSAKERDYWLDKLSGEIVKSTFPYDYKKIEADAAAGDELRRMDTCEFVFPADIFSRLLKLSNDSDPRLFIILSAAVTLLIYKYNNNMNDIIIGSPIIKQEIEAKFLNTVLVLRNQLESSQTFKELILQMRQTIVEATEHVNYSLESLLYQLKIPYSKEDFPLFDSVVLLENIHSKKDILHLFVNMIFSFSRADESISVRVEFNTRLYRKTTIERMILHLNNLLQHSLFYLDVPLSDIKILSEEEQERLLFGFNEQQKEYPQDKTISGLVEEQADKTPDHISVIGMEQEAWGIGQNVGAKHSLPKQNGNTSPLQSRQPVHLSYRELNEKANRLAHYLRHRGVEENDLVALMLDRTAEMVTAMLGILKAGGAYIPIDPALPEERIKNMINDGEPGIVISQKKYIRTLNRLQWECPSFGTFICLDSYNILAEEEVEKSELMDTKLWDYVAESAADEVSGGGWQSSYTGQFLSKEEMDEYGDNILEKLTPYLNKKMRVLEIGCASGISMYRIAPKVGIFYGTDLSEKMIENNIKRVKEEGYLNIRLSCLPAHEIDRIDEKFDLVIMNSVIQAFHGLNYLRKVFRKSLDILSDRGFLFIGDVMDQDKKQDLVREMKEFKKSHKNKNWKTKTDFSTELFVSRAFFQGLAVEQPEIQEVEFSDKIHTIKNELTEFRYDAFFKIDKTQQDKRIETRGVKYRNQHDLSNLENCDCRQLESRAKADDIAYVIFTSGTTGRPKGVPVRHRGFVNLVVRHREIFAESSDCRMSQVASPGFDAMAFEVWPCLSSGAALVIAGDTIRTEAEMMKEWLIRHKITISFQSTRMAELLLREEWPLNGAALRALRTAGDRLTKYPDQPYPFSFYNLYGPTEDTVWTTWGEVGMRSNSRELPDIGRPLGNHRVYILNQDLQLQPPGVAGELCIAGDGLAAGYLNLPELTAAKFKRAVSSHSSLVISSSKKLSPNDQCPMTNDHSSSLSPNDQCPMTNDRLYKTGDLARWLPDGRIDFIGRLDLQVKVRGYRIELAEIEHLLLKYEAVEKVVVTTREEKNNEKYLCAYIVVKQAESKAHSADMPSTTEFREYLSQTLPDYMIPSYFVTLDSLPVTANGKVDLKALPAPVIEAGSDYTDPVDKTEEKLVEIWSGVLNIEKESVSTSANFFELGGHSLKATILVSRIHKEMNVKVPLAEIFRKPYIKDLAAHIRNSVEDRYVSIEPAKPKKYYPLSAAQKRLFLLHQIREDSLGYNVPAAVQLQGEIDIARLEKTFRQLIERHESLRTSFMIVEGEPVQKIHDPSDIEFVVEHYSTEQPEAATNPTPPLRGTPPVEGNPELREQSAEKKKLHTETEKAPYTSTIERFIRSFDLAKPPLLRVGLIKTSGEMAPYILVVDMHHIITDGTSMAVMVREFAALYAGKVLPPLRIQYKDFSEWQNKLYSSEVIKNQQEFWLKQYTGKIPVLDLPTDYSRPPILGFAGNEIDFLVEEKETKALKKLALEEGATMYMVQLALFNILLAKISGQEDIIIGTPLAGRPHADLELVIGMFLNTLALRNYPEGRKSFKEFLREVKKNTLAAFENQDFQFEELVEKLEIKREANRNPLFDVLFNYFNVDIRQQEVPDVEIPGLKMKPVGIESNATRFDLIFKCQEIGEQLSLRFLYRTELFSAGTIERFIGYFREILSSVIADPGKRIEEIEIISSIKRDEVIFEFNEELEDE